MQTQGRVLLATVKGDVHDIGKNIVGVVLACNGYEVIDMGVMVPWPLIQKKVVEIQADLLGFSGLITPSLDEMIFNLKELQREGFKIPVLIGGATTSRVHTAVKMDSHYDHPVVHVAESSVVGEVCTNVLSPLRRDNYKTEIKAYYKKVRETYLQEQAAPGAYTSLDEARRKGFKSDWANIDIPKPERLGVFEITSSLTELLEYIDWSPFFWAWELKGLYPKIFEHAKYGEQAKQLFDDAQLLLKEIIAKNLFKPKAVVGIFPAVSENESVHVFNPLAVADAPLTNPTETFEFLRQRSPKVVNNDIHFCLSDFIAPKSSGRHDYLGTFAVTTGGEVEALSDKYKAAGDDYNSILVKALGDRFAEALAELTHKKVREIFAFGRSEGLSAADLIAEKYRGIRPAPGYPACPVHSEKGKIWKLLKVEERIGLRLTENFAMTPASSVSGFYFNHPQAKYFGVGAQPE